MNIKTLLNLSLIFCTVVLIWSTLYITYLFGASLDSYNLQEITFNQLLGLIFFGTVRGGVAFIGGLFGIVAWRYTSTLWYGVSALCLVLATLTLFLAALIPAILSAMLYWKISAIKNEAKNQKSVT